MKTVTINRNELLEAVKTNRAAHVAEYAEAARNYRETVLGALTDRHTAIANGEPISLLFNLPAPQDHTDDYDRVIRMLEMSVDENCTLDAYEFDCYVRDNWTWSAATKMINASYIKK